MQRDNDRDNDAELDENEDELRPEDLGIDNGDGPDLILGRDLRRAEQITRGDTKAGPSRANEPYIRYLVLEQLSDLTPAPVSWLWPGRIPLGRLTLLAGESRVGKSLVALEIAARVSRGACWPDQPGPDQPGTGAPDTAQGAGNVLILGMNGALAADFVPRLAGAGADLTKVFFADGVYLPDTVAEPGWKRPLSLADDLMSLAKTIRELAPLRLVILDPLWAFTGARGQSQSTRIADLAELAAESGVAIVGVADLQRDSRGRGSLRVKGERALAEAAHTVLGIVPHPEDDEMRVLLPLKTESAAYSMGTACFGMDRFGLEFMIAGGHVAWDSQPSPLTVESVLAAERYGGELDAVEEWLRRLLFRGGLPAKQVFAQARECGISIGTLKRAKSKLGVRVEQQGNFESSYWVWSLVGVNCIESSDPNRARIDEITCAPGEKPAKLIEVADAAPEVSQ
jgi:putative DNA primase/helicase